jgi:toxin HigB-1
MINVVGLYPGARRDLGSVPQHVAAKPLYWVGEVESNGLEETRKYPGFHDEPLEAKRKGQRSIRLSRAYRAIYTSRRDAELNFVSVEEVTRHGY